MINKPLNILYIGNNLTSKTKYNSSLTTLSNLLKSDGHKVYLSSNKSNKIFRLLDMCFSLIKLHKKVDFVLIDTFSTSNFYYALVTSQVARIYGIKYVPILRGGNLPYRLDNSKKMSKLIFNYSFTNIAPSNYLKHEFEKRGLKAKFIPNILEIDSYNFKQREVIKPNLLYVRAFAELYNPTMAIYVFDKIKKDFPDAKLCMVGPDKDNSLIKSKLLAKELDLQNDVEFTGVLVKEKWHKKSEDFDLFINTTNFDNTPVSVMEAMALGLPIVSTNAGGLPYLIEDGVDGMLVEKNDVNEMYKSILSLMKDSVKVKKMTMKARNKVEQFDWVYVKEKWNSVLN
ncbi:glycosyltransferase family 4 protein [Aureibaculum conchae]|uniref:glycosyltransferase family 4 protein n=1 Tax=Aureibaculum sp. 2308TA14-22 TaxID=3108392 RepID=UPI003393BD80